MFTRVFSTFDIGSRSSTSDICSMCHKLKHLIKTTHDPGKKTEYMTEKRVHNLRAALHFTSNLVFTANALLGYHLALNLLSTSGKRAPEVSSALIQHLQQMHLQRCKQVVLPQLPLKHNITAVKQKDVNNLPEILYGKEWRGDNRLKLY
ncbi:hypothetical protein PR048_031751 [Dryococelus australis]|uniref:Uncharacterized protein n=1 Tax=Dryococelus australis TaxID=614101 RepID=A0ABQ9G8Z0_9NEOP|nr:hypothetical protein PR048_031751 [Dryococelus australis]